MSLAALKSRLKRIEDARGGACDGGPTWIGTYRPARGEAPPDVPDSAARCPSCGEVHPLILRLRIVGPGDVVRPGDRHEDYA
jgi:hypothetical protein